MSAGAQSQPNRESHQTLLRVVSGDEIIVRNIHISIIIVYLIAKPSLIFNGCKSSTDLYVACDDNLLFHLLNIFTLCIAGSLGHALSMSSTSTGVSCRLVARWVCHSEKHSVSWTRWASAQTTSRRWAGNLDSCSSRLTPRITDRPPSAIAS